MIGVRWWGDNEPMAALEGHSASAEPEVRSGGANATLGRRLWWGLAVLLIGQFVVRGELSLRQKSPIWDEFMHAYYGLNFLRLGPIIDPRDHPYPISSLLALPLLAGEGPRLLRPAGAGAEARSRYDLRVIEDPHNLWPPRRMNLALASIGLLVLSLLVKRFFDPVLALYFFALGALDPSWMANARLITTDIAFAFAFGVATALLYGATRRGTLTPALPAGIVLACAGWAKLSAPLVLVSAALAALLPRVEVGRAPFLRRLMAVGVCLGIGALVYLLAFELHAIFGRAEFTAGVDHLRRALTRFWQVRGEQRGAFVAGAFYPAGSYRFFFIALLAKTPLVLGVLVLAGVALPASRALVRAHWPLFAGPLFFLAVAVLSRVNIGYRHLLPLVPFLWLVAALGLRSLWGYFSRLRVFPVLCLGVLALESLVAHPDYLAFANNLVGGVDGIHRVLVDSSSDWGQDLPALVDYLQRKPPLGGPVHLAYFGTANPRRYGIDAVWRPCGRLGRRPWTARRAACRAPAALLAVSATCLAGATSWAQRDPCYGWLRSRTPEAVLGGSILVYRNIEEAR